MFVFVSKQITPVIQVAEITVHPTLLSSPSLSAYPKYLPFRGRDILTIAN